MKLKNNYLNNKNLRQSLFLKWREMIFTLSITVFLEGKNDKNHLKDELLQGNDLYKSLWNPMSNDGFFIFMFHSKC